MSVPNRPESEYNAALKMWGGKWGAAIPLLLLICGLLWLSLHGPATPKNFWSIGFAAICIGLFLSKTPKEYCATVLRGFNNKSVGVLCASWIFASVFGQIMQAGGIIEGLLWFGLNVGAQGSVFTVITFLAAMLFSLGTGTANGTILALTPVMFPAGVFLGADPAFLAVAILSSGRKVSPLGASMANGFASNALDVEHGYRPAQGRPGAALTPVMLAAAEMAETPPSGTDMLAAVAVGYEVGMRSGMYWNRDHARVYTSGLWGAIGAVAAAGRILGLKEDVLLQALNCADYHGPVGFIARGVATPCMAKDGVGWGAHTAMMSILLAQAGFTSPLLDFDAALAEELGSRWRMADLYFKPYCCCRWAQASIAGALKIVRENHLAVSDIRRLVIHTFSKAASLSREHPTHTDAAQYNITYPIAVALLDGQISGAQVLPPRIFDKDVLELADMIEVVVEERFEERFPARTFSEVCITTTDGRELRSGELEPQWEPADSPSDEELLDKFTRLTAPVFGEQECARMREAIWHAEDLDNALDIWPRTLARHIEE